MSRSTHEAGLHEPAPEAERPESRSGEQEVAAGRTAATPVAMLGVVGVIALAVAVVLVIVVIAYALA